MDYLFLVSYHNFQREYCYEGYEYCGECQPIYAIIDCTRLNNIKDESTRKEVKIQSVKIKETDTKKTG
jgi:hypothetical protein